MPYDVLDMIPMSKNFINLSSYIDQITFGKTIFLFYQ